MVRKYEYRFVRIDLETNKIDESPIPHFTYLLDYLWRPTKDLARKRQPEYRVRRLSPNGHREWVRTFVDRTTLSFAIRHMRSNDWNNHGLADEIIAKVDKAPTEYLDFIIERINYDNDPSNSHE